MPGQEPTECSYGPTSVVTDALRMLMVLWSWFKWIEESAGEGSGSLPNKHTVLWPVVMFMYVHVWEKETGFPMGLRKKGSSRVKKEPS